VKKEDEKMTTPELIRNVGCGLTLIFWVVIPCLVVVVGLIWMVFSGD